VRRTKRSFWQTFELAELTSETIGANSLRLPQLFKSITISPKLINLGLVHRATLKIAGRA
jgi:hypothetical protein